jgi:hypothetical protein
MKTKLLLLLTVILSGFFCSAPRNIMYSGKVTPKGHFAAGGNMGYNIGTAAMDAIFGTLEDKVHEITGGDTIRFNSTFNSATKAMTAFALDPLGLNSDFYLRYGVIKRIDLGYSRNSGVNVFDLRCQFLGSTGSRKNPGPEKFNGSAGIQYSGQEYELPSFLGTLQSKLKYQLKRKDLLFPVAFSYSLGPEEKYGALGFGALYGLTWVTYDYEPNLVYELVSGLYQPITQVPRGENRYSSYGLFVNAKLGYRYVYGIASVAFYYQDFGTYNLFKDEKVSLKGASIVPSLGLQVAF